MKSALMTSPVVVLPPTTATPSGETRDAVTRAMLGLFGPDALKPHPYVSGNRADLLVEYAEWIPQLAKDIASATKVIDVVQFNWEDNGAGRAMADLLMERSRAGVEVNVIVDQTGSMDKVGKEHSARSRLLFDEMRAAGINVIAYKPKSGLLSNPLTRDYEHRKLLTVDHKIAHIGGMGLAGRDGKYESWRDLAVRLEGPAAAQAGAEFVASWTKLGGAPSERQISTLQSAFENPARAGAANVRVVPNTPGTRHDATEDFVSAAASAREKFWVMTPYIGDERAAEALIAAKKRGVDVRVIAPGLKVPNNKTETMISKTFYADLLKQGIPIYGFERMMHAKAWLADDRLTVGSTNLSRGGLRWYKEMSASVEDAGASAKAVRLFQSDFLSTPQIRLAEVTTLGTRLLRMVRKVTGLSF